MTKPSPPTGCGACHQPKRVEMVARFTAYGDSYGDVQEDAANTAKHLGLVEKYMHIELTPLTVAETITGDGNIQGVVWEAEAMVYMEVNGG